MHFDLDTEQQMWVSKAERLADTFKARARHFDESGEYPHENMATLQEEGFLALAVPREFGGAGNGAACYAALPHLVLEQVAAGCGNTGWALLTHYHHCGLLAGLGDDEQRTRIFGDVIKNGALMGSLGVEVNAQQQKAESLDSKGLVVFNASMQPVPGGFTATARKGFCSGAPVSKYMYYWAIAPGTEGVADGLTISVITSDSPGIRFLPGWEEMIGLRGSVSGPVKLENVFIPWKNVLGEPGDYVQKYPYTFDLTYAVQLLGITQGAYSFLLGFLRDRPYLQNDDTVMYTIGEMSSALQATRTSWWYAQHLWEQERWDDAHHATLRALHVAKKTSLEVTKSAFDITGVRGLLRENPLDRAWRDVRTVTLHTRESTFMKLLAKGEISGNRFAKEKHGPRLGTRKTWKDLGFDRNELAR